MAPTETFNPNARAEKRERETFAIGEAKYRRRRYLNEVVREDRKVRRESLRAGRELDKIIREAQQIQAKENEDGELIPRLDLSTEDEARIEELDDLAADLTERVDELVYARLALLLKRGEKDAGNDPVDPDDLRGELEIRDARDLLEHIEPEPAPDPTATETSTNGPEPG